MFRVKVETKVIFDGIPNSGVSLLYDKVHLIEACAISLLKEQAEILREKRLEHLLDTRKTGVSVDIIVLPHTLECIRKADPGEIDLLNEAFNKETS